MTSEQRKKCHAIIHAASTAAAGVGAGLAQLPCSDNLVIVPIQVTMIISLGAVFSIELSESSAKATIATVTATQVGRAITEIAVGWTPILGNIVNATTAATITEAIGWAVANNFGKGK